jgi:hypothetical protein
VANEGARRKGCAVRRLTNNRCLYTCTHIFYPGNYFIIFVKNSTLSTISTLKFLHYLPATHPQNHLALTSHPSSASFFASHLPTCAPIGVPTKSSEDIIFYIQKYFFSTNFQSSNWLQTWFDGLVGISGALFCMFVTI